MIEVWGFYRQWELEKVCQHREKSLQNSNCWKKNETLGRKLITGFKIPSSLSVQA